VSVCVWALTFKFLDLQTRTTLQIQDRSPESRQVASLNQSQTQLTQPVATGLGI